MTEKLGEFELNKIYQGDALELLKKLPKNSINCIITSPPYWGLRDYKVDKQIGLEENPQEYIDKIVEVMKECKRVLRDDGTIFLNLGDSFYTKSGSGQGSNYLERHKELCGDRDVLTKMHKQIRGKLKSNWLKHKQKLLIPYRIAIKCQDELGLILRNDIKWVKQFVDWKTKQSYGCSYPTSVQDRLNTNSEVIFLFVKSKKYYFNLDNIRIYYKNNTLKRSKYLWKPKKEDKDENKRYISLKEGKNPGDCIRFPFDFLKEKHFAVFPKSLPEFCILCGCPEEVCSRCGKPKKTKLVIVREGKTTFGGENSKYKDVRGNLKIPDIKEKQFVIEKCSCNSIFKRGVVLDPFMGSGTTAVACKELNRNFIGFELNPEYIKIAEERIK